MQEWYAGIDGAISDWNWISCHETVANKRPKQYERATGQMFLRPIPHEAVENEENSSGCRTPQIEVRGYALVTR